MAKKMYDILPPKMAHKIESVISEATGSDKKKRSSGKPRKSQKKKKFPLFQLIAGVAVLCVIAGVYLFFKLPTAKIEIWPKMDALQLQQDATVDKTVTSLDINAKAVPAQLITQEKDDWQEFPATGSASNDGQATGTITVYNKISPPAPFAMKVGTHFLSDSGKYFVTLQKVTVPAANGSTPGSVSVQVQAQESGPDYNIGASKFSVPKLSGTSYYYSIYGASTLSMSGGKTGSIKEVTADDISQAQDALTKKLLAEAEATLKSNLSPDQVLLDSAVTQNVTDTSANVKAGAVVDKFDESAKVNVSALVFSKQDIEAIAKDEILSQLPDDKSYLEKSLTIAYDPQSIDMSKGTMSLGLQFSVNTYSNIYANDIIDSLGNKSASQIKDAFNQKYPNEISDVKTTFWPFWVSASPSDKNNITIITHFE